MFSSRIQILLVESTPSKTIDPKTGQLYPARIAARCILLGDDGKVITVGRLRVPKDLQPIVREGNFRASFALRVPDFGDDKGDIVAVLVGLVEEPPARAVAPAPGPAAPAKVV